MTLWISLLLAITSAAAQLLDSQLTGTWSTKSNSTLTGKAFYDPSSDTLIEPYHTGISYSFSSDGFYESAWYRTVANPVEPSCPQALMQWQHGSFSRMENGSLVLQPIPSDGRQLLSDPCRFSNAAYTHYNESEIYQWYQILVDPYYQVRRLNMYRFDGSPLPAMYLATTVPSMLPTTTLHPTSTSPTRARATGKMAKRGEDTLQRPLLTPEEVVMFDANLLLWLGISFVVVGGFLWVCL